MTRPHWSEDPDRNYCDEPFCDGDHVSSMEHCIEYVDPGVPDERPAGVLDNRYQPPIP